MKKILTTIAIIIFIVCITITILAVANLNKMHEQENKIIDLYIELDNAKEIIDKQQLQIKNYEYRLNAIDLRDRLEAAE